MIAMMGQMHKESLGMRRRRRRRNSISIIQQLILLWVSINAYVAAFVPCENDPMMQPSAASKKKRVGIAVDNRTKIRTSKLFVSSIATDLNFDNNYHREHSSSCKSRTRTRQKTAPPQAQAQSQQSRPKLSRKKQKQIEEFQWLNWVYNQWRYTRPGELTEEVLRQMAPAISRWSKRKTSHSGDRAEELLERIIMENLAGNSKAELTVSLFNSAMDAHAKIGNPVGVQRVLRRMENLRRENDHLSHLRPDVFSMSTLATAWAKVRSPDAAAKAEDILNYMEIRNLTPNTITYNAVLHAMAVSNQIDKAIRAEDLVQHMKDRCTSGQGDADCQPDIYTYQALIQAWSRTCLPGSPQKAEQILRFLDEQSEKGDQRLAPNSHCFTAAIHAWSRSSEKNRARNAYQLLNHMRKRYIESQSKNVKPNVVAFTSVLNACALPADESEKVDAFAIAQLTMSELLLGDMDKPNFLSFAAYFSAISSTVDGPSERRDQIVKQAFLQCRDAGQVGQIVLDKLTVAASPGLYKEMVGQYIDEETGEIDLPASWTGCIKGERRNSSLPQVHSVTRPIKLSRASKLRLKAAQKFGGQSGPFTGKQFPPQLEEKSGWISWSQRSL